MSWWDDAVDAVSDTVSDVGSGIADAAEDVGSAAADAAGASGGYLGDAIGAVGGAVNTATGGAAGAALNLVDDTVFDGVDYITDGAVNIDYDDGTFSASAGIPGVAEAGASIGEHGITASSDTLIGSTDVGVTDTGLSFESSGGIDWGPLPYYDGHMDVTPTGDVSINGHIQGTVPTPYGLLSGQASGGFVKTDDGWGTYVDGNGTLTLPSGTVIGGALQGGYMQQGDNSQTTFGVAGSVTEPGVGTIGGSFGYSRTDQDGVVLTTEQAEAHASGYGMSASAGESYVNLDTPAGSITQWNTEAGIKGPGGLAYSTSDSSTSVDPNPAAGIPADGAPSPGEPQSGAAATAAPTPGAPSTGMSLDDDVLGTAPAAPAPVPATGESFASAGDAAGADPGAAPAAPGGDDEWATPSSSAPADVAAPVDDFSQQVSSADQIDQDASSMFDDLGN